MPEVLIWGASGAIGRALVTRFKSAGWRVFAAARNESRIPPEADFTFRFDAAAPHTFDPIPALIAPESEGLDLVIYAAGALRSDLLERMDPAAWNEILASNLTGAYLAARASLQLIRPGGQLLFIGAYVAHITLAKMGAYAAAKSGLDALAAVLQKENRKLRVSILRPGPVDTPFWTHAPFRLPADARAPEAIAEAVLQHTLSGQPGDLNL